MFIIVAFVGWSWYMIGEDYEAKLRKAQERPPCIVQNEAPAVYVAPYQVKMTKTGRLKRHCEKWALDHK